MKKLNCRCLVSLVGIVVLGGCSSQQQFKDDKDVLWSIADLDRKSNICKPNPSLGECNKFLADYDKKRERMVGYLLDEYEYTLEEIEDMATSTLARLNKQLDEGEQMLNQLSSENSSSNKTSIATCKSDNPVDCAVAYIKDNYNIGFFTLADDVQAYTNTETNDWVIDVTIKGENSFGGTVFNTFRVIISEDGKNVYSCVQK